MIQEAQYLMNNTSLSPEEIEDINDLLPNITEREWESLRKTLIDKQTNPLQRIKNGELIRVKDLNIACFKASKSE